MSILISNETIKRIFSVIRQLLAEERKPIRIELVNTQLSININLFLSYKEYPEQLLEALKILKSVRLHEK